MELSGAIHGDAISVAPANHAFLNLILDPLEGIVPADRCKIVVDIGAEQGLPQAALGQGFAHSGAFDAHLSKVGGVLAIAASRPHRVALRIAFHGLTLHGWRKQFQTAANTAVRALATHAAGSVCHGSCTRNKNPGVEAPGETTAALRCRRGDQAVSPSCSSAKEPLGSLRKKKQKKATIKPATPRIWKKALLDAAITSGVGSPPPPIHIGRRLKMVR